MGCLTHKKSQLVWYRECSKSKLPLVHKITEVPLPMPNLGTGKTNVSLEFQKLRV